MICKYFKGKNFTLKVKIAKNNKVCGIKEIIIIKQVFHFDFNNLKQI